MPLRAMEINEGSGTDSASLDDDNSEPLVEHLAPDDAEPMDSELPTPHVQPLHTRNVAICLPHVSTALLR